MTQRLQIAAAAANIRARDWITAPRNDGSTLAVGPQDLSGDLQLPRAVDGSYAAQRTFDSVVFNVPGVFNVAGLHWVADVPDGTSIAVLARGSTDGQHWGPWLPTGHILDSREGQAGSSETFADAIELGRTRAFQYRIVLATTDPARTPTVQRVTATQIDALDAPTFAELDRRGKAISFALEQTDPPSTRFVPRDGPIGWGPDPIPPDDPLYWPPLSGVYPYEFVTIHHTAGQVNPEKPLATVRGVWYYHAITLGWGDIGYHFLIDQFGNVYEGRDGGDSTEAGHVFRYNHYNCGVVLLGQFQPGATDVPYPAGEPTRAALNSATLMAALESALHEFDPQEQHPYPKPEEACRPQLDNYRVCSHRDWHRPDTCYTTSCPGDNLYKHLPTIRAYAAALVPRVKDSRLIDLLKSL